MSPPEAEAAADTGAAASKSTAILPPAVEATPTLRPIERPARQVDLPSGPVGSR